MRHTTLLYPDKFLICLQQSVEVYESSEHGFQMRLVDWSNRFQWNVLHHKPLPLSPLFDSDYYFSTGIPVWPNLQFDLSEAGAL